MKRFTVRYNEVLTTIHKAKVNNEAMLMIESDDPMISVADEYHSMKDLYEHRMALNIALFNYMHKVHQSVLGEKGADAYPVAMKSKLHADGTMFDGYFIVMLITPMGQVSYHYKLKHWDKFNIPEMDRTPEYDGHTAKDVLERLMKI